MYKFEREDLPKWPDLATSLELTLAYKVEHDNIYPYQDFGPKTKVFFNKIPDCIYGGADYRAFNYPSGYNNIHARLVSVEGRLTALETRYTSLEARMDTLSNKLKEQFEIFSGARSKIYAHEAKLTDHEKRIKSLENRAWCQCP